MQKTQQGLFGKRLAIWMRPRTGGRRIPRTAIWVSFERISTKQVAFLHLTVGNPRVHYRWAFNAYFYYRGV